MPCVTALNPAYMRFGASVMLRLMGSRVLFVSASHLTRGNLFFSFLFFLFILNNNLDKSFPTREDAQLFVNGKDPSHDPKSAAYDPKYYAVRYGRIPGVYLSWPDAEKQIIGWKGPKYKAFTSRKEAEEFVRAGPPQPASAQETNTGEPSGKRKSSGETGGTEFDLYESISADDEINEFELSPKRVKHACVDSSTALLKIYTDGSSINNGKANCKAGVGVYFGPRDPR